MKAIIILDLDDNWVEINKFTLDKLFADITLYEKKALNGQCDYQKRVYRCFDGRLKPLPQKNKYDVDRYATVDYENNVTLGHYLNKGWNDCIDEILGEEHE